MSGAKLPTEAQARKNAPIYRGVMKYFPRALAAVAELSRIGNEQHNPGQPMHWAREKSTDHGDCIARHQIDAGTLDSDGQRHSTKVAWRALAQLELELEAVEQPKVLVKPEDLHLCGCPDLFIVTNMKGEIHCSGCGVKIGQGDPLP